jgi:hypothetical protein
MRPTNSTRVALANKVDVVAGSLSLCGEPSLIQPSHLHMGEAGATPKARLGLVWKAFAGLLIFDLLGLASDFTRMYRFIRRSRLPATKNTGEDSIHHICAAINRACTWYPWRVRCLQRSAVTVCLLSRCGVSADLVIGVQHLPFKAHAWTEVHGRAINEGRDVQRIYSVLERC